ncbi:MAG: hypothetical protein JNL05_13270 [Flavobacteriales bacterium]|nr:hypothetical protein [Flavobacteriales bacterium]
MAILSLAAGMVSCNDVQSQDCVLSWSEEMSSKINGEYISSFTGSNGMLYLANQPSNSTDKNPKATIHQLVGLSPGFTSEIELDLGKNKKNLEASGLFGNRLFILCTDQFTREPNKNVYLKQYDPNSGEPLTMYDEIASVDHFPLVKKPLYEDFYGYMPHINYSVTRNGDYLFVWFLEDGKGKLSGASVHVICFNKNFKEMWRHKISARIHPDLTWPKKVLALDKDNVAILVQNNASIYGYSNEDCPKILGRDHLVAHYSRTKDSTFIFPIRSTKHLIYDIEIQQTSSSEYAVAGTFEMSDSKELCGLHISYYRADEPAEQRTLTIDADNAHWSREQVHPHSKFSNGEKRERANDFYHLTHMSGIGDDLILAFEHIVHFGHEEQGNLNERNGLHTGNTELLRMSRTGSVKWHQILKKNQSLSSVYIKYGSCAVISKGDRLLLLFNAAQGDGTDKEIEFKNTDMRTCIRSIQVNSTDGTIISNTPLANSERPFLLIPRSVDRLDENTISFVAMQNFKLTHADVYKAATLMCP